MQRERVQLKQQLNILWGGQMCVRESDREREREVEEEGECCMLCQSA